MTTAEMPLEETERHLLASHKIQPRNLAVINELTYYYAMRRPNPIKANYFENLFKQIVDENICRIEASSGDC